MPTHWIKKVYAVVATYPPIFDFLERGNFWKVYNSTQKRAINNLDTYLLCPESLQRYGMRSNKSLVLESRKVYKSTAI